MGQRPQGPVVVSAQKPGRRPNHQARRRTGKPAVPEGETVPGLAPRQAAARLLSAVLDAHTPLDALTDGEHGHPQYLALDGRDRALVRAILISALRFHRTIETIIAAQLDRPLPANARSLAALLHVAAAQILFLDVPDSAAVNIAVAQAKADPRSVRFAALVNAVLRNVSRSKETLLPKVLEEIRDAPDWMIRRLEAAYGRETARRILDEHRSEPPVDFSVKSRAEYWAERLGGRVLPNGSVRVENLSAPIPELPGFAEGEWWVQDAAASLPPRLLGDVSGLDVADLCAAPGGKTAALALAGARVTAVDQSGSRLKRLKENLARLGLAAEVVEADILKWLPGRRFDAILLDAPCSSTGTARRHPDVLWAKTPEDIAKLANLQRRLLERSLELVKPGGTVVFANCSLDREEGEDLILGLLKDRPDVLLDPIRPGELPGATHFITSEGWLRTTPEVREDPAALSGVDGFFAARLRVAGR